MLKRILTIALVLFICGSCSNEKTNLEIVTDKIKTPNVKKNTSAVSENFAVYYKKQLNALENSYRLKPDKRVLLAVSYIHHFFTQKEIVPVEYHFNTDKWLINYQGLKVGELPELFDFQDIMVFLKIWAEKINQIYPLNLDAEIPGETMDKIAGQVDQFLAPYVADALHEIDRLWDSGRHSPALVCMAAQAMVLLAFQGCDRLEIGDSLPAKALSILTLAKTLAGDEMFQEESLLAYTMGYSNHAVKTASNLSPSDAIGLFVKHEDQLLKQLAVSSHGNLESRYLYLMHLANKNEIKPYEEWFYKYFSETWYYLPVFKTRAKMAKFSFKPIYNNFFPRLVILSAADNFHISPELVKILNELKNLSLTAGIAEIIIKATVSRLLKSNAAIIDHFETGIKILNLKYKGPFLDSRAYEAFYLGYFFSSLYDLGLYNMDTLSSVKATSRFEAVLGNSENHIARSFQTWYRSLAKSKAGKADLSELVNNLVRLTSFGFPPLQRTLEEQQKYYGYADPAVLRAVKQIVTRMDTRVDHRRALGDMAQQNLLDLKLMEKLYQSVIDSSSQLHANLMVWFAYYSGDHTLLLNLFESSELQSHTKAKILFYLTSLGRTDPDFIQEGYEQLIAENPNNWNCRNEYSNYLKNLKQYAKARTTVEEWLARDVETNGLAKIFAQGKIAWLYYEEGQYEDGWDAIEPVVKSGQAGAMELAAKILGKLNKKNEAILMARRIVSRYPDVIGYRTFLAKLLWLYGQPIDAAAVLESAPHKIGMSDWRFVVGAAFSEIFSKLPVEKGLYAFNTMLERNFNHFELQNLVYVIEKTGNHELAFEMSRQLKWNGVGNMVFMVHSYRNLKEWKGKNHALDWLKSNTPLPMRNPASMIIYKQKEFDLLWDLISEPETSSRAEYVWLIRAAASISAGSRNQSYHQRLLEHYNQNKTGFDHLLGRFLLGLSSEKDILPLLKNKESICIYSYYKGLKNHKKGNYAEASDWYRRSIETGLGNKAEYRFAYDVLYNWKQRAMSLKRLSADKL